MSIDSALQQILASPDPFICLVKGEWGVGKTFYMKDFINKNSQILNRKYLGYVSLFGIDSISLL